MMFSRDDMLKLIEDERANVKTILAAQAEKSTTNIDTICIEVMRWSAESTLNNIKNKLMEL